MNGLLAGIPLSDAATITANNEDALFPVENVQTIQPGDSHRTTDLTNVYYIVDFGAAVDINLFTLWATNAAPTDTWRIRTADLIADLTTASASYDSGNIALWATTKLTNWSSYPAMHYAAGISNRYARIDITSTTADGYFEIGRLRVDNAWLLPINVDHGFSVTFVDDTEHTRGVGPRTFVNPRPSSLRRQLNLSLSFQSKADMYDNALQIDRLCGKSKDVVFIADAADMAYRAEESICGMMMELTPIINESYPYFMKRYVIEELPT